MEIKREHQINIWYVIGAFLAVMAIQNLLFQSNHAKTIPYSEFQQLIDQDKVTDLVIGPTRITGTYREPQGDILHFATERVPEDLAAILAKKNISFSGEAGPGILT